MNLSSGKLSNYNGQAKEPNDSKKIDGYLSTVDKDLQNIWRILNDIIPLILNITADVDQFAINSGTKLGLEGNTGDTYWKYNSATAYLEGWVDGVKRMEL